jgi:tRNA(fMet)-specific endonuclease VapC
LSRWLLDTSVLIPFRDGDGRVVATLRDLGGERLISIISRVELEGGLVRVAGEAPIRRQLLDMLLSGIVVLPFTDLEALAYREIVASAGYSRRKLLDRMIAAQAIVADARLVTLNPGDFDDVPGLKVHPL